MNRGLEDKQAQTQQEFQSIREENRSLRNKVEVENESLRLAAEVNTVDLEIFVCRKTFVGTTPYCISVNSAC